MNKITITEALSEINLIKKKIEHKKKTVLGLVVKPQHIKDPYVNEGGTTGYLNREFQAISDLEKRLVSLRGAISIANCESQITVGEIKMSIHDWLTWKREVSKEQTSFVNAVVSTVKQHMDQAQKSPQVWEDAEGKKNLVVFESMIDYPAFIKKQEMLAEIFENLDGQLSLKNATVTVSI